MSFLIRIINVYKIGWSDQRTTRLYDRSWLPGPVAMWTASDAFHVCAEWWCGRRWRRGLTTIIRAPSTSERRDGSIHHRRHWGPGTGDTDAEQRWQCGRCGRPPSPPAATTSTTPPANVVVRTTPASSWAAAAVVETPSPLSPTESTQPIFWLD